MSLVLAVTLTAAGCGTNGADTESASDAGATAAEDAAAFVAPGDADDASATAAAETSGDAGAPELPVTVFDDTGTSVTVESIERIIPLDGDVAEVVFALGLGGNVVATDLSATYPPEADALPEIGYQRALSAETVASYEPTVLLATDLAGPPAALDSLRRLGYPLVIVPNDPTPTGAGRKIRAIAAALGIPERGDELADSLDAAIAAAAVPPQPDDATDASDAAKPRVMALYMRGTAVQLVLGQSANTHWLIEAAGGVDVSEEMGLLDNTPISAEAILLAAPDVLVIPEVGLESVGGLDKLLEIAGLGETPAGQRQQVLVYDDQLLMGNGPRTAEVLAQLREDLSESVGAGADE